MIIAAGKLKIETLGVDLNTWKRDSVKEWDGDNVEQWESERVITWKGGRVMVSQILSSYISSILFYIFYIFYIFHIFFLYLPAGGQRAHNRGSLRSPSAVFPTGPSVGRFSGTGADTDTDNRKLNGYG